MTLKSKRFDEINKTFEKYIDKERILSKKLKGLWN